MVSKIGRNVKEVRHMKALPQAKAAGGPYPRLSIPVRDLADTSFLYLAAVETCCLI